MKKLIMMVSVIIMIGFTSISNAAVLDFEDINSNGSVNSFASFFGEYGGFNWSGESIEHVNHDDYWTWINTDYYSSDWTDCIIGEYAVSGPSIPWIWQMDYIDGEKFTWDGAYFSTPTFNDSGTIQITGYNDGVVVESVLLPLNYRNPTYFDAGWENIDSLVFTNNYLNGNRFMMDNFIFTSNAVPIPGTVWLLGCGLVGLVRLRKYKHNLNI